MQLYYFRFSFIVTLLCISAVGNGASKPIQDFKQFFTGVKYAYVVYEPTSTDGEAEASIIQTVSDYLKNVGFERVESGRQDGIRITTTYCDLVMVYPQWTRDGKAFTKIDLKLTSCKHEDFQFVLMQGKFSAGDVPKLLAKSLVLNLGGAYVYNVANRLKLDSEPTDWTEEKLKSHYDEKGPSPNEGIYERFSALDKNAKLRIGLLIEADTYRIIYLGGSANELDWQPGEMKGSAKIIEGASFLPVDWKMNDKWVNKEVKMMFESGYLVFQLGKEKLEFIKRYPSFYQVHETKAGTKQYGSGFALTREGYVVTNWHVVDGAKKIKITGINEDFGKSYSASVVAQDKNNDLAILKISDSAFSTLPELPYTINARSIDVGKHVYVIGYPLKSKMGDEIKLTDGIVSSKSGYEGNVTTYQISAPIQPGNSGGPVFDDQGSVIGIISSKLVNAENASYAIKTSYLVNLIDSMPQELKLPVVNGLAGKSLSEQVKVMKKFTYIIEVTN